MVAGRYQLRRRIGAGATGQVWRALDRRTGTEVAVKVRGTPGASMVHRYVHEQSVRITHPHVAGPVGWAAEDDLVVVVTDLVRGGSLADLLAEHGPLPVGYVATVLDQVLAALVHVHAAGWVHRDVTPGNVLVDPSPGGAPHTRLADFGIAAPIGHRSAGPGLPSGTPAYRPPESGPGLPADPSQDLWSVGVLAVHLLTGRPGRSTTGLGGLEDWVATLLTGAAVRPTAVGARRSLRHTARAAGLDLGAGPAVPDRTAPGPRASRPGGPVRAGLSPWWVVCGLVAVALAGCLVTASRIVGAGS